MVAMVIACAGVVLAQSTEPESNNSESNRSNPQESAEKIAAEEDTASSSEDLSSLSAGDPIPGRYIVVLKNDARPEGGASSSARDDASQAVSEVASEVASEMAQEHGLEVKRTYGAALKGFSAEIPEDQVDEVRSDPRVKFVSEDRVVEASAQHTPTGIRRSEADSSPTAKIDGVDERVDADIAVLDTGVAPHPDLNRPGGVDCSSDGYTGYYSDGHGHGTHVAGSAAAKDNAAGVVGVAPGARVWAVKVLSNTGSGSWSDVICGINWATANKSTVEVANMSLGGYVGSGADDGNCGNTNSDALHQAICNSVNAGVPYTVAAGNDYDDASYYAPASYDEVITVSALADYNGLPNGGASNSCNQDYAVDDDYAWFSNYGSDVDLAAPGVCITSTWKATTYRKKVKKGKRRVWKRYTVYGYKTISGTSMASPHVAGAAALYKSKNPSATPSGVRTAMISAANTEAEGAGHTDIYNDHDEPFMLAKNY